MLKLVTVAFTKSSCSLCLKLLEYTVIKGDEIAELKATAHSILKRLKDTELGLLLRSLETRGGDDSNCVFYSCGERVCKRIVHEPQVVLYRTFRQPSVQSSSELKQLAVCSGFDRTGKRVCINPYHYSEIVQLETQDRQNERVSPKPLVKNTESSGFVSDFAQTQSTDCPYTDQTSIPLSISECVESASEWPGRPWCFIAYWELSEQIGPFYHGQQDIVNIYETLPKPRGFCLAALARNKNVADVTKRVRDHVGFGLQLSREDDGVWIYNRSDHSIFANGPPLADRTSDTPLNRHNILVYKVPPGFSLKIYDYNQSPGHCRTFMEGSERFWSPRVPESVRISFAKGWGSTSSACYRRPFVTSCPCWVEIHFNVSR